MAITDDIPGAKYGARMRKEISDATNLGGVAAGIGQGIRMLPGAPLAAANDIVENVAEPIIRPYAQALKTAVTGDATPIGQSQQPAVRAHGLEIGNSPDANRTANIQAAQQTHPIKTVPQPAQPLPQYGVNGTGYVRNNQTGSTTIFSPSSPAQSQGSVQQQSEQIPIPRQTQLAGEKESTGYNPTTLAGAFVKHGETKRQSNLQQLDNQNALLAFEAASRNADRQSQAQERGPGIQGKRLELEQAQQLGAIRSKLLELSPDDPQRAVLAQKWNDLNYGTQKPETEQVKTTTMSPEGYPVETTRTRRIDVGQQAQVAAPAGMKLVGTSGGKQVYEDAKGNRFTQ